MRYGLTMAAAAALSLASVSALASVTIYQTPKAKSKVVETLSNTHTLIPIFASKDHHGWLKVANTANGQVGWMKLEAPKTKMTTSKHGHMYTERIVTTHEKGQQPHTYKVIQYTSDKKLSKAQVEKLVSRMDQNNRMMQANMHRELTKMDHMFVNMQNMMQPFAVPAPTPTVIIQCAVKPRHSW